MATGLKFILVRRSKGKTLHTECLCTRRLGRPIRQDGISVNMNLFGDNTCCIQIKFLKVILTVHDVGR
jgi:hypothetical protein